MSNEIRKDTKVLIISWSPVPTPKYQKIEGSGQRFFGLATGLQKNGIKDITIAIGHIYPLDVDEVSGIKLFNYDFDNEFAAKLAEYDTVILNYAIHGASFVIQNLPNRTQVIIDAYGPAYIESLARDPEDLVGTYVGNLAAVNDVFNVVLPRGDYFLYANDAQEKFYTGVLATLGVINQFSYNTQRLLRVPFGIDVPKKVAYQNPYTQYGIEQDDFVLLWFGGLYPWFDITKILDTVKNDEAKKIKLVIVGGNNPQNQHPDFVKHYKNTVKRIQDMGIEDSVILIDWVDYATRRKYYEYADAIISMNNEGKENVYSWRTRVMDYVGSQTPLITNGGDPLSDELIEKGAAFKVDDTDRSVQVLIKDLVEHREKLVEASHKMQDIQPKYYWQNVTEGLAKKIKTQEKPHQAEREFRLQNNITDSSLRQVSSSAQPKRSLKGMLRTVIRKIREKGFKTVYKIVKSKVRNKLAFEYRKRFPKRIAEKSRIIIVSNQLNNTGAPFVIMDVVHQLNAQHPDLAKRIKFIAFTPIEAANVTKLENEGINVEVHTNRELPIEFNKGDVVVFNTFAVSRTTIFSAIHAVNQGKLQKIFWYGHEAAPDSFIEDDVRNIFTTFLENNKAKIYAVSEKTQQEYIRFFKTPRNIERMPFRFMFPENEFRVRKADDFTVLRFITPGSIMDMRKGQYPILYAFLDFYHNYYVKNPDKYRDFHLDFIGAYEKQDLSLRAPYHIQNIMNQLKLSSKDIEAHFSMTASMPHDKAIEAIGNANITLCYSLNEALPIFIYEGMATGHPIVRNDCAGQKEQLLEGRNGFGVSSDNFAGLVDTIEKLLNKQKTTNRELANMSRVSHDLAKQATKNKYQLIDEIRSLF